MEQKYELDPFQKNAVCTELCNALVVAPPGSGKTTVIINRLDYIIRTLKTNPENIAVITFTRAAAMEMQSRFYTSFKTQGKKPFFGTLHSLFYKILKRENDTINIIDEKEAKMIIRDCLRSFLAEVSDEKVRETINNISVFKTSCLSLDSFCPTIDKNVFHKCYNRYEEHLSLNNLLDFDDLQLNCMELFKSRPEVLQHYRDKFKYILIDEFQDCDELQLKILQLLNSSSRIFAVGDEDQSIYGFRGAKPESMVEFQNCFKSSGKIYLAVNYRCPYNVVELSKSLIQNNFLRNEKPIKANSSKNSEIIIKQLEDEYRQAVHINDTIKTMINDTALTFRDFAVLYRTNTESKAMIDIFVKNKTPFRLMDREYNFYDHFICKDIIAYLKLSQDFTDKDSLLRIINKPNRYAGKLLTLKLKDCKYRTDCFDFIFENNLAQIYLLKILNTLRLDLIRISRMDISLCFEYILNSAGYLKYLKEYSSKSKIDFTELQDVISELKETFKEFRTIEEFLSHVKEISQIKNKCAEDENKDAVVLSTIHGVKGMEFKNVFIINCNEDNIPFHRNGKTTNIEEERRLLYVAATRTKERLWIFSTSTFKGKVVKPSIFISELLGQKSVQIS